MEAENTYLQPLSSSMRDIHVMTSWCTQELRAEVAGGKESCAEDIYEKVICGAQSRELLGLSRIENADAGGEFPMYRDSNAEKNDVG